MDVRAVYTVRAIIAVKVCHFSVGHLGGFRNHANDVHTEAVYALIAPPGHHIKDIFSDGGVIPIEIRLFFRKQVKIKHICVFIILPCGPAKAGTPVVGRCLFIFSLPPDVVISAGIVSGAAAFHKPLVLIRSVVNDKIHDDADAAFMSFVKQLVKIFHSPKFIHDRLIIADVISVIVVGRLVYRGEPDDIDSQIFQIIQLVGDSL